MHICGQGMWDEFDNLKRGRAQVKNSLRTLPKSINEMNYARMLQERIESVWRDSEPILDDLQNFSQFSNFCETSVSAIVAYKQDMFENWTKETLDAINDRNDSISLSTAVKIMELDHKDGQLKVNFRERLWIARNSQLGLYKAKPPPPR